MRLVLLAVVFFAACQPQAPRGWEAADSAGVRVVLNHQEPDELSPPVSVADTPSLVIGTTDGVGETSFFRITDVARIGENRLAIADGGSNQIRMFDSEGNFIRAIGREGEGPGEFRGVRRIGHWADTLWVFDEPTRRITMFDGNGDVVATREIGFFPIGSRDRSLGDVRLTPERVIVGMDWSHLSRGPFPSISVDTAYWAIVRADDRQDVVAEIEGARTANYEIGTRRVFRFLPLTNIPSWDFFDGQIYLTSGARHEIRVVGLDGDLGQIVRRSAAARVVDDEFAELWKDSLRMQAARWGRTDGLEDFLAAVPIADSAAVYDVIHVDPTGLIWAQLSRWEGVRLNPEWELFGDDGVFLGNVEMPVPLRVLEIGEDYVLGVWTDEFDVEFVHLYDLQR